MSQTVNNPTQITLPAEQVESLRRGAQALGLSLSAYLAFLEQCRCGRLDARAQDAAQFMFSKHSDSLRKLAE